MARVDLHVHSKFSDHPSEWFLQRIGTAESYTEPDFVYQTAKNNGMTFVTLTDHNKIDGALYLKEKYPHDFFTGVEVTTYFPEDKCKMHVLVYDLNDRQFNMIQKVRKDIYDLRDYLLEQNLAHSLAHATYAVNGKVSLSHIEKCILLFDVFEGINGSRTHLSNTTLTNTMLALTPDHIDRLYNKYNIEPASEAPWIKGFTGGSDDHAGLFISKTYGESHAVSVKDFIKNIKNKNIRAGGRHNDFDGLAFAIYKIAYDFSKKKGRLTQSLLPQINNIIFNNKKLTLRQRLNVFGMKARGDHKRDQVKNSLIKLFETLKNVEGADVVSRLDIVYEKISDISDAIFTNIFTHFNSKLQKGDLQGIVRSISSAIPAIFLSVPFFSTLKHMYQGRSLLQDMKKSINPQNNKSKTIMWFTDTFTDLNGVAQTLNETARMALQKNKKIIMVTSVDEEKAATLPGNVINLPSVFTFALPYYEQLIIRVPSVLKTIKQLIAYDPDEIYISSPGPVGLLGMLYSRLISLPCVNVFHTDFTLQAHEITKSESIAEIAESYMRWFYGSSDTIKVLTEEYKNILIDRGYPADKMKLFIKSVDVNIFKPQIVDVDFFQTEHGIPQGVNLLYVGRVSEDKGIDFLLEIYKKVSALKDNINLIIVGDGPNYDRYKKKVKNMSRVFFTGRVKREMLPDYYSAADLFLFPSTTDTFGMVVLEAQACGLPAIVSDVGGPKEIIKHEESGFEITAGDPVKWTDSIFTYINEILPNQQKYTMFVHNAVQRAYRYSWDAFFNDVFNENNDNTSGTLGTGHDVYSKSIPDDVDDVSRKLENGEKIA